MREGLYIFFNSSKRVYSFLTVGLTKE